MSSKPHRGTNKHVSWMVQKVIQVAEMLGVPVSTLPRETFLQHAGEDVTRTDIDACMAWSNLKALADTKAPGIRGPVAKENLPFDPSVPEGYFVKQIATQLNKAGEVEKQWIKAPLEQATGSLIDAIPEGHAVAGVSTLVSGDGHMLAQWVKTRKETESQEELIKRLFAELPTTVPARAGSIPKPATPARDDLMAVYPLGDPHVGLLAWKKETGADFDLKICEDLMVGAMRDLVLRGPRTKRAMVLNLGDFYHFDTSAQRTTKGEHTLDVDGRSPKVLAVGLRIMYTLIDAALEHHDEVLVDCRIGNHDGHTSLMLSLALGAHYRNEPRVVIPPTIRHRAYYEFGKVMIGTTHGDRAKGQDLESLMAAEEPEMWGRTRHRYILCGHIHHSVVKEYRGCKIESFRTLAGRDGWHASSGYVSGRDMHRIVYHADHGEISREIVNVSALLGPER
jgi:hypothetical protein